MQEMGSILKNLGRDTLELCLKKEEKLRSEYWLLKIFRSEVYLDSCKSNRGCPWPSITYDMVILTSAIIVDIIVANF
jgi:hypothetical protein